MQLYEPAIALVGDETDVPTVVKWSTPTSALRSTKSMDNTARFHAVRSRSPGEEANGASRISASRAADSDYCFHALEVRSIT